MIFPAPVPGLVIRYSYLWHREHLEGREEGQKDRPCSIVAAIRSDENGAVRVLVLPVTHGPPVATDIAMEIPRSVKERLGLDAERSWIILSEANEFAWPGPDLRPIAIVEGPSIAYGVLPPGFFNTVRQRFRTLIGEGRAKRIQRTE